LSPSDLPLWARGFAGVLLAVASWWLLHADPIRSVVGPSVALIGLAVVAVSLLRGMHLPLGVWPNGPWRERFSGGIIAGVGLVLAALIVISDPVAPEVIDRIDPGMFAIVIVGTVVWGLSWALVSQRAYLGWYGLATMFAVLPLLVGVMEVTVTMGNAELCMLPSSTTGNAECPVSAFRAFGFMLPVYVTVLLVTVELTFRRLLIGHPSRAGLGLVVLAALVYGAWVAVIAGEVQTISHSWWMGTIGAVGAGSLYVLSESLLVSCWYTALLLAGQDGLSAALPRGTEGAEPAILLAYVVVQAAVVLLLAVLVVRRHGVTAGLRR